MSRPVLGKHPSVWFFIVHRQLKLFTVHPWTRKPHQADGGGWVLIARGERVPWIVLAILGLLVLLHSAWIVANARVTMLSYPLPVMAVGAVATYFAVRQLQLESGAGRTQLWIPEWPLPNGNLQLKLRKTVRVRSPIETIDAELILDRTEVVHEFGKRKEFQRTVVWQEVSVSPGAEFPEVEARFELHVPGPKDDTVRSDYALVTTGYALVTTIRRKDGRAHRALFDLLVSKTALAAPPNSA